MVSVICGYQVTYEIKPDGRVKVLSAYHASSGIQCSYGRTFSSYEEMVRQIEAGIWAVGSGLSH